MLVIRLARTGRKKYPTYRIVAAESARATTGKFVAILGHYNPHTKELVIKKEETLKHLGNGAQPSNAVVKLLQREKVELPSWVSLKTRNRAPKKEAEVTEETPATEAPASQEATGEASAETEATEATEPHAGAEAAVEQEEQVAENSAVPADSDAEITETAETEAAAAEKAAEASETAAEIATEQPENDDKSAE